MAGLLWLSALFKWVDAVINSTTPIINIRAPADKRYSFSLNKPERLLMNCDKNKQAAKVRRNAI